MDGNYISSGAHFLVQLVDRSRMSMPALSSPSHHHVHLQPQSQHYTGRRILHVQLVMYSSPEALIQQQFLASIVKCQAFQLVSGEHQKD